MRRLALALLLVGGVAVAQPTKAPTKVEPTKAVVTKAVPATKATPVTKAAPVTKVAPAPVTKVVATKAVTKVVVEVKAAPAPSKPATQPKPVVVEAKVVAKAPASQPASAPASQKLDVPKDTVQAASMAQQALQALQHKKWRHLSGLIIMLLIFFWRRYGEKLLLHRVPDRYMGLVVAGVAVVYSLGLALLTAGKFDWTTFLSTALTSGGESFFAWECGGKFALEKALGETPAKKRRKAACKPEAPKTAEKPEENKSA